MKLNPYLYFDGTCEEAMRAYAELFGAEILAMMRYEDMPLEGKFPPETATKIAHARLRIGDQFLMASDSPPGRFEPMQGAAVTLNIPEPDKAQRIYDTLMEGGTEVMPLEETFWAYKFGVFVDRFGTQWMINCEKPRT